MQLINGIDNENPNAVLTATDVFGGSPWLNGPTVSGPAGTFPLNQYYYATPDTAALVQRMVGGTAVTTNDPFDQENSPGDVNAASDKQLVVVLPGGGRINAGLVAQFFTHGYPLSFVAAMIASEVRNIAAGN